MAIYGFIAIPVKTSAQFLKEIETIKFIQTKEKQ